MWYRQLPICLCATLTFLLAANAGQLRQYAQSAPLHYYHYPTPRHQLTIPQHQQRHQQQYQPNYISYAQTHQRHVQQQQTRPQYHQQHQQQQQYRTQPSLPATSYYQNSQHLPASVTQRFAAPALENAAFTTALTNQGYTYGGSRGNNAASSVSSARALPPSTSSSSASTTSALPLPSSLVESLAVGNDIAPEGAIDPSDASVNLKLPLPVNIVPIKVEPLPLQEGASFNELAHGVTSYGTVYPQRKRR